MGRSLCFTNVAGQARVAGNNNLAKASKIVECGSGDNVAWPCGFALDFFSQARPEIDARGNGPSGGAAVEYVWGIVFRGRVINHNQDLSSRGEADVCLYGRSERPVILIEFYMRSPDTPTLVTSSGGA
jgi:hypothetical protein